MLETSARLLRLLSLFQSRRFWPGGELAAELEVTERTVRRDVDRLRSLGYPVQAASGVAGGYQLGAGAVLPPLLLDDDEALAVSLGLRTAATGSVTGMEEAALRALAKIEHVMPAALRRRIKGLHAAIVPMLTTGPTVDADVLAKIASSCRNSDRLQFRYGDGRGNVTDRVVEPLGLVHTGSLWYLVAWDPMREDFRTFRVDRIDRKVTTGVRFVARAVPGGDLARYVARSVSYSGSNGACGVRAIILLEAPLADIQKRIPSAAGRLEARGETRCVLHTGAYDLTYLALHIARLGVEFEVQEPAELTAALQTIATRLQRGVARSRRGEVAGEPGSRERLR